MLHYIDVLACQQLWPFLQFAHLHPNSRDLELLVDAGASYIATRSVRARSSYHPIWGKLSPLWSSVSIGLSLLLSMAHVHEEKGVSGWQLYKSCVAIDAWAWSQTQGCRQGPASLLFQAWTKRVFAFFILSSLELYLPIMRRVAYAGVGLGCVVSPKMQSSKVCLTNMR